jgi:GT2 family glycosyltransferase/glycosyltransferase involved in cell wall biosynthesis
MSSFYSRLFFHKSGKPRGFVRYILFKSSRTQVPRKAFTRLVFQKDGHVRPRFGASETKASGQPHDLISQFLAALAASNGTVYRNAEQWYDSERPEVSIVILNWNKGALTAQCLHEIWKHTDGVPYEIVVLDNGSLPRDLSEFVGLPGPFRLICLRTNRMFGEGNNIAAETAKGKFLLFLNNDAFVTPGWLAPLVKAVQQPLVGAVGPLFVYPDGKLQECGSFIDPQGDPKQRGKGLDSLIEPLSVPQSVHYVSAACILVQKRLFEELDGFSLDFEPAYYEDVDLCFRLRKSGYEILYLPETRIIHIENYSTREMGEARHQGIVLNRQRFIDRHRDIIGVDAIPRPAREAPTIDLLPESPVAGYAGLYTPFALTPGGGERVLLSLAAVLSNRYEVVVITPEIYSAARLRQLGKTFGLDLSRIILETWDDSLRRPFDIFFSLGNTIVPDVPALAPKSFYLCQFPFPMAAAEVFSKARLLSGYRGWLAYSEYAKNHIEIVAKRMSLPRKPVTVVFPPCRVPKGERKKPVDRTIILSVGRFFRGDHCKNHHLLVQAFNRLIEKECHRRLELHIAGSMHPNQESLDYFDEVSRLASALPVTLHPNADAETLNSLYEQAHIYWHGTGMDKDPDANPEAMEHFGIAVVEAMGAGCVPMAFSAGGPAEIITDGSDGCLYRSEEDLIESTLALLHDQQRMAAMAVKAKAKATDFSMAHFSTAINGLILGA